MPQPPQTDFRLYPSNDLDVLAGVLGELLRAPGDGDWWREEWVLVPQYSMRRWLQQLLAGQLGICANVRFVTPGEFVDHALEAQFGPARRGERLLPETLRWHLLRELRTQPPGEFAAFLDGTDPRRQWSLATTLADTFERYQAWRRDLLLDWERRAPRDDGQAQLWRRIGSDKQHRARRIDQYLQRFGAQGAELPSGLPSRLFVFACQNVSPDVLQVVASQARTGVQHFFLHTPSRVYWGDLARWAADYQPDQDDRFGGDNPLLAAWGQAGRDFIAALGGGETVHARLETPAFTEPPGDTLLGRIQCDLLENRAPLAVVADDWPRPQVDRADDSLQFHACHTRLREVQVLHDQLRALLEQPAADGRERIDPRDVAVLMPDVDAYAPHVEAVFGGALGTAREIPYTIADTSPLASAAIADAFLRLLQLPLAALTLPDLVDLLAVPALAERFDLNDADRDRLQDWLQQTGARRGLDGADRARHDGGDASANHAPASYTFEFALDRLLLGIASGDDTLIAGPAGTAAGPAVAPWPQLEGQDTGALDALVRLLAVLRDFSARLQGPHAPREWSSLLSDMLAALFAAEPRDNVERTVLERLRQMITEFADSAVLAGFEQPVEHSVLLQHFQAELGSSDARAPFLSGGVCFGRMVPMRLIPFRVICLLGMEEAAFPARDGRDPVNRINQALDGPGRRVGDPSRRDADRYLFLQLFSSASRVFYNSWIGMNARDGSRREPSMLVSELLDAATRYHADAHPGDTVDVREQLVVRHALQPFSPAAFGAALPDETAAEPRRFSYDERWHPAAGTAVGREQPAPFASTLPPRDASQAPVSLSRLRAALMRPHEHYLRDGLDMRLPEEEAPLEAHEPFGNPDALARYNLRQDVFVAWLHAGAAPDLHALQALLLARGQLPSGADGGAVLQGVLEDVAPFAKLAVDAGFSGSGETLAFDLPLDGQLLAATLDQVHPQGVFRAALNPNGRHGGHAVRHGLDWLAASTQGLPLHELSLEKPNAEPWIQLRPPLPAAQAQQTLSALLALHRRGIDRPLPFLPKSGHAWWKLAPENPERALEDAARIWSGGDSDFGGPGEAKIPTRIALRGRDPFLHDDLDARESFEHLSYRIFNALEHGEPFDPEALP